METNYMKNTSNKAHFFDKVAGSGSTTLPNMHSLVSIFRGFRPDLLLCIKILRYFKNVYFPEKPLLRLVTVARFSKYSFPQKLYI